MNLRPTQKMKFSQNISYNWNEFSAETENEDLSELFLNWNESAAKTEKDIVSNNLVELEVICG